MRTTVRLFSVVLICLFLLADITGCQRRTTPEPTFEVVSVPTTTIVPVITEIIPPDSLPIRIRLLTTSDWTDFKIISGADFTNPEIISSSSEAQSALIEGNHFILDQELARSETGAEVEMVIEGTAQFLECKRGCLVTGGAW